MQARGWGTWPCPSQGKALAQQGLSPPHAGAASPQEIPSAPLLLQNMFWEVTLKKDGVDGLFKKRTSNQLETDFCSPLPYLSGIPVGVRVED